MATLEALKVELDTDPLTRGYSGMTDAQAADDLNTVYRTRGRTVMTGDEVFATTEEAAFISLSGEKRHIWVSFCGKDALDPFGVANVAFVKFIFGQPSPTITALLVARTRAVSRTEELGFSRLREGTVAQARAL